MNKKLKILGLGLALVGQLLFNSRLVVASENFNLPKVYISRISSIDGNEFIELYNAGDDLLVKKLVLAKGSSRAQFLALENRVLKAGNYVLFAQNDQSDAQFSGNQISGRAVLQIQLDDFKLNFCAAGKACPSDSEHAGFDLDNKTIVISAQELAKNGLAEVKKFKKISLNDQLAAASFGGLSESTSAATDSGGDVSVGDQAGSNDGSDSSQAEGSSDGDSAENGNQADSDSGSGQTNQDKESENPGGSEPGASDPKSTDETEDSETTNPQDQPENPPKNDDSDKENACQSLRLNEIYVGDGQWVEIINISSKKLKLDGCSLNINQKTAKYNLDGKAIDSEGVLVIGLSEKFRLPKTKAALYLLDGDETEVDFVKYENLKTGSSFAKFGDEWKATFAPTKGEMNIFAEFAPCPDGYVRSEVTNKCQKIKIDKPKLPIEVEKPCQDGYYRHSETGRCRKIAQLAVAKVCPAGYYLNQATNRCRKIDQASANSGTKTPCREGYYRHPETGRCRKIEEEKTPAPCRDGYERNPETGRCRKIVKNQGASDKLPDDHSQSSQAEFSGWWALAAVLLVGAALIIWEFRAPLARLFKPKK